MFKQVIIMPKNANAPATKLSKAKLIQRFGESFRLLNVLNFNLFYGLSLLIMLATGGAVINLTLLALVNLFFGVPLAVILSPIQALFSYNEAKEKNWRTHPTLRFIFDGLYALAILGLAITLGISFLLPTAATLPILLLINIPLIITVVLSRALYNIVMGIKQINKSQMAVDATHHDRALAKSIANITSGLGYGLIAVSMVTLYFFPLIIPPALFIIGAIGCTLTLVAVIVSLRNSFAIKPLNSPEIATKQGKGFVFNSDTLHQKLKPELDKKVAQTEGVNPLNSRGVLSPANQVSAADAVAIVAPVCRQSF